MTVELLQSISIGCYIASGSLLLISVVLFFWLDIPKLYGEISGKTAQKAIQNMQKQRQISDGVVVTTEISAITDTLVETVEATSVLSKDLDATMILSDESGEKTILTQENHSICENIGKTGTLIQEESILPQETRDYSFMIESEIVLVESLEIIQ